MARMPKRMPVPGFPRWTGLHVRLGPPDFDGLRMFVNASVSPITYRARIWWAWRALTRRGVPDAAPLD